METMVITDSKQVSEITRKLRETYSPFSTAIRKEERKEELFGKPLKLQVLRE